MADGKTLLLSRTSDQVQSMWVDDLIAAVMSGSDLYRYQGSGQYHG